MRIVENALLTVRGPDDWYFVRSPSRARRRLKYGHRQNIRATQLPDPNFYVVGDVVYCHPAMAKKLRDVSAAKAEQLSQDLEAMLFGAICGKR